MKAMPYWEYTVYQKCRQVYDLLVDAMLYDEARAFGNAFVWDDANIADVKAFFKKRDFHPSTKHKVFLILNNKACYFRAPRFIYIADNDKRELYVGYNLIEERKYESTT